MRNDSILPGPRRIVKPENFHKLFLFIRRASLENVGRFLALAFESHPVYQVARHDDQ